MSEELVTKRQVLIRWFVAGCLVALFLMWTQAIALGGWTSLLAVGEDADIRPVIAAEIPNLTVVSGSGNDGQIYYAIALDPFSDRYADLLPEASLRWRRIVMPLLASGFGIIDGTPLFWTTVAVVALSLGVATAAAADVAQGLGLRRWVPAALLLHPGIWIGVRLLSPDILAIASAMAAIALALRARWLAAATLLCLAVLTKEPYLIVACSLAAWTWFRRQRVVGFGYFLLPFTVLIAWSAVVRNMIPGAVFESGNIALPFAGIVEASRWWPQIASSQNLRTAIALLMLVGAIFIGLRYRGHALLHWLLWPWVGLALVTSHWVWRFGNGSLRAFAFLGVIAVMMVADPHKNASAGERTVETETVY